VNAVHGVDSPSYQSTYQPLSPRQTDDTHMYGDQGMIYTEPMAGRGTYQPPTNRPIKSSHAVQSPVYNQFNHGDIINGNKQPLQAKTSSTYMELDHAINPDNHHKYGTISTGINPENNQSSNQPIRSSVTSDTANHNYLILEPDVNTMDQNASNRRTSLDAHQYFVLESDSNPVPGTSTLDSTGNIDTYQQKKHDYFILEDTS